VTAGAMILAVPIGIATATFVAEIAPPWSKTILKTIIEVLATIPSVVYGFIGLITIAPLISKLPMVTSGQTALLGSIMLAIMSLPTIISIAEDGMHNVPISFRMASFSLGANRWQTIRKVVLPAAKPSIFAAIMLGMGRVIGETMTVLMVTGNAASIPKLENLFYLQSVRTLTATIAQEMGEVVVGSPHYHALFMIGLILFLITFFINLAADLVIRKVGRTSF
jgi:phosphate transport system permease protein